jgi:hypothetical protein
VSTNESWSLLRKATQEPHALLSLQQCYLNNQFWVFPAHRDYDPATGLDRFQGVTPCALLSVGSSGSDRYYVRAALAASAAMRADVKKAVKERNLFGPLMQYVFRRSRKGVESEADYFSEKAHPTAFDRATLDAVKAVRLANGLAPDTIPPAVLPLSAFVPVKSTDLEKELDLAFRVFPDGLKDVSYCWHVVHGDRNRVKIEPGGDGKVHLSVDCRSLAERIDVACFAKSGKSDWGAPSFICIYPLAPAATQGK